MTQSSLQGILLSTEAGDIFQIKTMNKYGAASEMILDLKYYLNNFFSRCKEHGTKIIYLPISSNIT